MITDCRAPLGAAAALLASPASWVDRVGGAVTRGSVSAMAAAQ